MNSTEKPGSPFPPRGRQWQGRPLGPGAFTMFLRLGLFVLTVFAIVFAGNGLVPAWSAHEGHGTPGELVAARWVCGQKSCRLMSDFYPEGSPTPSATDLAPGPLHVPRRGDRAAGVLAGGELFPPGGGDAWLADTLWAVVALVGVIAQVAWFVWARRRRQPYLS